VGLVVGRNLLVRENRIHAPLDILLSTVCADYEMLPGVQIDEDTVVFCATERRTAEEIEALAAALVAAHDDIKDIDSQLEEK